MARGPKPYGDWVVSACRPYNALSEEVRQSNKRASKPEPWLNPVLSITKKRSSTFIVKDLIH